MWTMHQDEWTDTKETSTIIASGGKGNYTFKQQVQQTLETVSQAQLVTIAAYQKATEVVAENVQAHIAAEIALKKVGEIVAENV